MDTNRVVLLNLSTPLWKFNPKKPEPCKCWVAEWGLRYSSFSLENTSVATDSKKLSWVFGFVCFFFHLQTGKSRSLLHLWVFQMPEENLNLTQLNILDHETSGTIETGTVAHYC